MKINVSINTEDLVDIREVHVDENLSKLERIVEFIRQIKNPYLFKCGDVVVGVKYASTGMSFEDCLERIVV